MLSHLVTLKEGLTATSVGVAGAALGSWSTAAKRVIHCLEQKAVSLQCAEMQVLAMLRLFQLSMWLTDALRAFFHIFPFSCRGLRTAFESPDILISSVLPEAALCLYLGY